MKTIYLTNIPSPYTENRHELVYKKLSKNYLVIYCAKIEPNRKWSFKKGKYKRLFLKAATIKSGNRNIYIGLNIINILNKEKPNVLVLNGLAPAMIFAFIWAKYSNCKVIASTDANILTEELQGLNVLQKIVRILMYPKFDAYIGASKKTLKLFESYDKSMSIEKKMQIFFINN